VSLENPGRPYPVRFLREGIDLFSIEDLCKQVQAEVAELFKKYPRSRFRLKAIGGGGGKGQRILGASLLTAKNPDAKLIEKAAAEAPGMVRRSSTRSRPMG